MKLINYVIVVAGCFAMAACTSSDILNDVPNDTTTMTKVDDDLETIEIKLEVAGTLLEKLGDKKDKVQKMVLSGLVDADDVTTFRSMVKLTVLDMKGVEFAESEKEYLADYWYIVKKGKISHSMFLSLEKLVSVVLPDEVVEIERDAFALCSQLQSIKLSDNLQIISTCAFQNCISLKDIKLPAKLLEIDDYAFRNSGLKSIDIPPSTQRVGFGVFGGALRLSSIFVNGKTTVEDVFAGSPNCLFYLSDPATNISPALFNIIINGVTPSLKLSDINWDFFCPKEFKTQKATYTKTFDLKTISKQSVGWYSLSLPFDVTTITHEDGRILAPFNSGVPNSHPFWLRKLTANGFENATSIKAGESYIIAMPNNEKYAKEYNLAGKITFSAQDATNYITIPVTTYKKMEGPLFDFNPSYECQDKKASVYVLNEEGSAFVRSLRDSRPFEAYVTNKALSTKAPDMFFIGSNIKTRSTHTISDKPSIDDM